MLALVLDDQSLTFDEDLCDGCALCVPACPEQAIDLGSVTHPLVRPSVGAETAFLVCEKTVTAREPGMVSCLHAVSTAELAWLHARGVRALVAAEANCADCRRRHGLTLSDRIADLTRLTSDRGLPHLMLREVDVATWREERDDAGRVTRRSLFRAALGGRLPASTPPGKDGTAGNLAAGSNGPAPPDALLDGRDRATLASFSPAIDHTACVACGACVEVCAYGAVRLSVGPSNEARYEIDARLCTGCALCIDSCEPHAITVLPWGPAQPPPVPLVKGKCRSCSSPFYAVARAVGDQSLCRICASKSSHHKLFQVLP